MQSTEKSKRNVLEVFGRNRFRMNQKAFSFKETDFDSFYRMVKYEKLLFLQSFQKSLKRTLKKSLFRKKKSRRKKILEPFFTNKA